MAARGWGEASALRRTQPSSSPDCFSGCARSPFQASAALSATQPPLPHSAGPAQASAQAFPWLGPLTPEVGGWPPRNRPRTLPRPCTASGGSIHWCLPGWRPLGPARGLPVRPGESLRLGPSPCPFLPPPRLTWGAGEPLAEAPHGPPLGTHFLPPRSAASPCTWAKAPPRALGWHPGQAWALRLWTLRAALRPVG